GFSPEREDERQGEQDSRDPGLRQGLEVGAARVVAKSQPRAVRAGEVRQPPREAAEPSPRERRLGKEPQRGAPQDRPRRSAVFERQRRPEELTEPVADVPGRASSERGSDQNDQSRDRGEHGRRAQTPADGRERDDRTGAQDRHQEPAPRSGEREPDRERQERGQRPSRPVAANRERDADR